MAGVPSGLGCQLWQPEGGRSDTVSETCSNFGDSHALFEIQYVSPVGTNTPANTLFDNSSSASLITHSYAEQQGFSGEPISYWLVATGYQPQLRSTTLYKFSLQDSDGAYHKLAALGIETITNFSKQMNLSQVKHFFPQAIF